jgi:uncharacterized Zn-finger protein
MTRAERDELPDDTESEDGEILCPWCRDGRSNPYDFQLDFSGDSVDVDCERCGKPYRVTLSREPEFIAEAIAPTETP